MTTRITSKNATAAALLLAGGGFIMSLLIEYVGLLVPCELCLIQRWSVFAAMLFLGVTALSAVRWLIQIPSESSLFRKGLSRAAWATIVLRVQPEAAFWPVVHLN